MAERVNYKGGLTMTTASHIRWMLRRDLPAVVGIDADNGGGWSEEKFLGHLRQRKCIGMILEEGDTIRGFMVYELHREHITLLRFAAELGEDHDHIAQALVAKLLYKLVSHRRSGLDVRLQLRPEWATDTVTAMCAGEGGAYPPILADALEEAGCAEHWLLDTLRSAEALVAR